MDKEYSRSSWIYITCLTSQGLDIVRKLYINSYSKGYLQLQPKIDLDLTGLNLGTSLQQENVGS